MSGPSEWQTEVLLHRDVSPEQQGTITEAFEAVAGPVRVRRALAHRGPEELQWLVLASLPLQAFLSGLGGAATGDAYAALKNLVNRVLGRPQKRPDDGRVLVLRDSGSDLRIVLEAHLPAAAYQQLLGLDLSRFRHGPLHYDLARGRWRSELDEAASPP
jgi:hypothetical protein